MLAILFNYSVWMVGCDGALMFKILWITGFSTLAIIGISALLVWWISRTDEANMRDKVVLRLPQSQRKERETWIRDLMH
jgi:hypothetical protein